MSGKDSMNKPADLENVIICLNPNDVTFGRGSESNDHEGNIRFRSHVNRQKREYREAKYTLDKKKIVRKIVNQVHALDGRFLKRVKDTWVLAEEKSILLKVTRTLTTKSSKDNQESPTDDPALQTQATVASSPESTNQDFLTPNPPVTMHSTWEYSCQGVPAPNIDLTACYCPLPLCTLQSHDPNKVTTRKVINSPDDKCDETEQDKPPTEKCVPETWADFPAIVAKTKEKWS
jgi:hypothetical protein